MHIRALRIKNFRRLKNVQIDLNPDISIFVGANNSGKTSTTQALKLFTEARREKFSIHDFNAECWKEIDAFGNQNAEAVLPKISIDIWLHVEAADLHRAIELLPSLQWEGSLVGIRIEFMAADEIALLERFRTALSEAQANRNDDNSYHPSPRTLCEYLTTQLKSEFEFRHYVLDIACFDKVTFLENQLHTPRQIITDSEISGKRILEKLLRVDFLNAQRHLSDSDDGSRSEDLSRCLSRFYERNLEKSGVDYKAIQTLAESEKMLNEHLSQVFEPTLQRLSVLNYPGVANPTLLIKSALNPATIMKSGDGARVHYELGNNAPLTLPDRYNGLGYKNLIYMVVELLDIHAQWMSIDEDRPLLHLVFIEEPEVHLHAQLQQAFIRKVLDILKIDGESIANYRSQLVVTTHSPHILYERGFKPIRYFRRTPTAQTSEVLNLSAFYESHVEAQHSTRNFLERYLKLTHCDLFFADAAVLVEGNVERLLLPLMIEKTAPELKSAYLSILEIGGAFGHRFRSLIEFLGITALIITDIDSVVADLNNTDEDEEIEEAEESTRKKACLVDRPNAETSNQTLIQWLPKKTLIAELLTATDDEKTQRRTEQNGALIRVAYQTKTNVTWKNEPTEKAGRTLEEAFAFQNLVWCQDKQRDELGLCIPKNSTLTLDELTERLHKRIKSSSFNKTDFALALLTQSTESWAAPSYIAEGLKWLENEITPTKSSHQNINGDAV